MLKRHIAPVFRMVALCAMLAPSQAIFAQGTGILREVYEGISGNAVSDLTNAPAYPDFPNSTNFLTDYFEAPINILESYGQRIRGYVLPPESGFYTFWISSDDNGALYLSPDEEPAHKQPIAAVPGWTASREWTKYPEQQSSQIWLEAGRRYYVEMLQKEGGGGDNAAVGWQLPNSEMERPIPATRLLPEYGSAVKPAILVDTPDQTVVEATEARFFVLASDPAPVRYQWQRGTTDLPGMTNSLLVLTNVLITDDGKQYRCVLSNNAGSITGRVATLNVMADLVPPTIVSVANLGPNSLQITFSEPVEESSATNKNNYALSGGITVSGGTIAADGRSVVLAVSSLVYGTSYTLIVSNVHDRSSNANPITQGTQKVFTALEYTPTGIGGLASANTIMSGNRVDITTTGGDIGLSPDRFQLNYQQRTGDFDVQVRLASLSLADDWSRAGLMARETLDSGARYAAVFATPSISGSLFQYRQTAGQASTMAGSFPVNYPNTWLRLRRAGNVFTGFASYDGLTWTQLGAVNLSLPSTLYFGYAVTSHSSTVATTAQFRDLGNTVSTTVGRFPTRYEPPGPSNRRGGVVVSEIMYHPADRVDGRNLEFVEIFNTQPFPEDFSNWRLSGDADFTFPPGTTLPGGGIFVVAKVPNDIEAVYGITNVYGPYSGSLPNDTGTVRLRNQSDAIMWETTYQTEAPWPIAPDGGGHSLVLARPSYGEASPKAWLPSDQLNGSPGRLETERIVPLRAVMINEVLAHTDLPDVDYVELYNHSTNTMSLAGCTISDSVSTNRFTISAGVNISPGGFISFDESALGFRLSAAGETVWFRAPDGSVLDVLRFADQENGVSFGRWPNGSEDWYRLSTKTPGAANTSPRISQVVINEVMYSPVSRNDDDEYIELFNRGTGDVDISGWRLTSGVTFTFPTNTIIGAGQYLVIARNAAHLQTNYAQLDAANCLGDFQGKLSGSSDRIVLRMPDEIVGTNGSGALETNIIHIAVDEVTYGTGGEWPTLADGGGSSLERIDARANSRLPSTWAASDESTKAAWVTVGVTNILTQGSVSPIDALQIELADAGDVLIDNVEMFKPGGANLITNSTFETNLDGWTYTGTHRYTILGNEGFGSAHSMRIRAVRRGDPGANRVWTGIDTNALADGDTVVIRCKARWLAGSPEFIMKTYGNWLEAYGNLQVPTNLGTPGLPNSRAAVNIGPGIYEVKHTPALPAANEPVVVTARLHDPDGVSLAAVQYRIDPDSTLTTVYMVDNGTGGDAVAGDGIYSATIPGQSTGTLAAFRVAALDSASPTKVSYYPPDVPVHECLVRWGEVVQPGSFGTVRFYLTDAYLNFWKNRERMANDNVPVTIVYGNDRIIYLGGGRYSGSPFHQGYDSPIGNPCDYDFEVPADNLLLGANELHISWPGNGGDDPTAQNEQTGYWILNKLGVQANYRRYLNIFINGVKRGFILEDTQVPDGDVVDQWFPDHSNGDIYKIAIWFEFVQDLSSFTSSGANLNNYTYPNGQKIIGRYRWNWQKRSLKESITNYTSLFPMIDTMNTSATGDDYTKAISSLIDVDQWLRTFAVAHIVGNWDAFGSTGGGQNMFSYKPDDDRWKLMTWDLDISFCSYCNATDSDLFAISLPQLSRMANHPPFKRMLWRAYQDAVNGPLSEAAFNPLLDGKFDAFASAGVNASPPDSIKNYIRARRQYIIEQLATVNVPFAVTDPATASWTTNVNFITISGAAAVGVQDIRINGQVYPVSWINETNWQAHLALSAGANNLVIDGLDNQGNIVSGTTVNRTITVNTTAPDPADVLAINEIMYDPTVPGSSFIEIYNRSTSFAFDLSGWKLDGVSYTFPAGSIIEPQRYLVIAKDAAAFATAYPGLPAPFDEFSGSLQNDGETLKLEKPTGVPGEFTIVDRVTYEATPPWPTAAAGTGASLQLIDPAQDNDRVGNWAALDTNAPPQWQYVTQTGVATSVNMYLYLTQTGSVYLDDIKVVAGSTPEAGPNLVANGDFENGLTSWNVSANHANSTTVTSIMHSGSAALLLTATSGGTTRDSSIWQTVAGVTLGQTYTISYWWRPYDPPADFVIRFSGGWIYTQPGGSTPSYARYTPGIANSVTAALATFPTLRINEAQPENTSGITDRFGEHEPWIEIFNHGSSAVSMNGLYLAQSYTNLTQWAFPTTASIPANSFLVVFADAQPAQSDATEFHTNFRLTAGTGQIALTRIANGSTNVVDYLNYNAITPGQSYGKLPDGQPNGTRPFFYVTPGTSNNPAYPPVTVRINEWMAQNDGFLQNMDRPGTFFDDWLELYNPADTPANLSGYYLTDDLSNSNKFEIPAGFIVPAKGYRLVWADNQSSLNIGSPADLHADFQLSAGGESIGLFAPDGAVIDALNFGPQSSDVSMGRYPDATAQFYFMPQPTPRAANVNPGINSAPVIPTIPTQYTTAGRLMSFAVNATDAEAPPQTLTFSLDTGYPPGAGIDASSGIFSWTPTTQQTPSTNVITVRVTDDGASPQSTTRAFTAVVMLDPSIANVVYTPGAGVTISWATAPGLRYRVDYTDSLNPQIWLPLTPDFTAQGTTISLDDNPPATGERYYRVVLLQ
ncbi:hypothetical protein GC207_06210 [bacterium]|nr:hypothetical protein [bacterium]